MAVRTKKKKSVGVGILRIAGLALTLLILIAVAVNSVLLVQAGQMKEAYVPDTSPRVEVPEGHFAPLSVSNEVMTGMWGARLTPGVDLYTNEAATAAELEAELDELFSQCKVLSFKHVLLDLRRDDKVIFTSEQLYSANEDLLAIVLRKAGEQDISVSVALPLSGVLKKDGLLLEDHTDYRDRHVLVGAMQELAQNYEVESILLYDYYLKRNGRSYQLFMESGGDGDYDTWLTRTTDVTVEELRQGALQVKSSLPVGLLVSDVWANAPDTENGSETQGGYQALYDGHADTRSMVLKKTVDFVMLDIDTSISNKKLPFQTLVDYWAELCKQSGLSYYVLHCGERAANGDYEGWVGTDELARQVALSKKSNAYRGSCFTGLSRLSDNPQGSTELLLKYYADEYSDKELFTDLEISSPTKQSIVTYETNYQFRMRFDPNADVLLNGVKVVPTERGGASVWVDLEVGHNTFTLSHKGRETVYKIERKVVILQSVDPTEELVVPGNATITFNVVAYKGSRITATLNGKTITLEPGGGEGDQLDSSYINYQGTYKVPKSTNKDQPLGTITFKGSFMGYSETKKGADVTVSKDINEVDPDEATGKILTHAVVTSTYANTYPYKTASGYPQAILYQLPRDTVDIVSGQSGDYIHLRSGKTVKREDVQLRDIMFEGNNRMNAITYTIEPGYTVIRIDMNWRSPFSLTPSPYPDEPEQTASYEFNADTITLYMDYTTTMDEQAIIGDLSASPIFSEVSYDRVFNKERGIYQFKIILKLRRAGRYYGCHAEWEGNTLKLRFNHPGDGNSLAGVKICVDAGHGGRFAGTTAGRDVLEKTVNLQQAMVLADALRSYGATVYMIRTDDVEVDEVERVRRAEQWGCHLYIAVHHNSAGSNSLPSGAQTYFNAPFSQPLAKYVQAQLNMVMPDKGWNMYHNSTPNYNFIVTRERQFPSILLECGFLSNPQDEALAMDPSHRARIAQAVARGVMDYYRAGL